MVDIRHYTLFTLTAILIAGTAYSVLHDTYLDTSNPLLTHLPHKLAKTHYFAAKTNVFNTYFIKKLWGWTSVLFFFSYLTSPVQVRTKDRLFKYLAATTIWLLFTSWFFGPALLERFIVASGGECILALPSGGVLSVPNELCFTHSTISHQSHPHLFPDTFSAMDTSLLGWASIPRLRRGHDISGHVFLLTLATLFLADQLRPSFKTKRWTSVHTWAVTSNIILIGLWLLAALTTSVYFHSPMEKLSGYLLGLSSFMLIQALFGGEVQIHPRTVPE
ncbi:inositol phospholipid synthesis and fat-storage-inducing TM-domain-containing protein [Pholiota molesta]|nr:inositol phospholipid synthesis and fat-storage-inducing TM-domain-containing protein [Pholiota molesta]